MDNETDCVSRCIYAGKYRIITKINEGNYSKVYEAESLADGGAVALKIEIVRNFLNCYNTLIDEARILKTS